MRKSLAINDLAGAQEYRPSFLLGDFNVRDVAEHMVIMANATKHVVVTVFNDKLLSAHPGDVPEFIIGYHWGGLGASETMCLVNRPPSLSDAAIDNYDESRTLSKTQTYRPYPENGDWHVGKVVEHIVALANSLGQIVVASSSGVKISAHPGDVPEFIMGYYWARTADDEKTALMSRPVALVTFKK